MTIEELSNEFDVRLGSYVRKASFGKESSEEVIALDEYEKSLYLTRAQDDIVLSLYNGQTATGRGFEESEEERAYLNGLVREQSIPVSEASDSATVKGKAFLLDSDVVWFIIWETVTADKGSCGEEDLEVLVVSHDEYNRLRKNPFRGANSRRALRLDYSSSSPERWVEIVCKYPIISYNFRYLMKPKPIILENLPDGLEIKGYSEIQELSIPESLHKQVLDRAVALAYNERVVAKRGE